MPRNDKAPHCGALNMVRHQESNRITIELKINDLR